MKKLISNTLFIMDMTSLIFLCMSVFVYYILVVFASLLNETMAIRLTAITLASMLRCSHQRMAFLDCEVSFKDMIILMFDITMLSLIVYFIIDFVCNGCPTGAIA